VEKRQATPKETATIAPAKNNFKLFFIIINRLIKINNLVRLVVK
jgi:hypothetical protein